MIPSVRKGEKFQPSAANHNEIAEVVNRMNGFQEGKFSKGAFFEIKVPVLNTTGDTVFAGSPVVIDSYDEALDIFKIRKFKADDVVFGCVKSDILSDEIGIVVLSGVVKITATGQKNKFVRPTVDAFAWEYSDSGVPILASFSGGEIIFLSAGSGVGTADNAKRPFWATYNPETGMIDITGGWVLANGEYLTAKADSLGVMDGIICVTSKNEKVNTASRHFNTATSGQIQFR